MTKNPESMEWNPESKTVLDSLTGGDTLFTVLFFSLKIVARDPALTVTGSHLLIGFKMYQGGGRRGLQR